jgi:hypothetical protein
METVSIRNLRGASLREYARTGQPLAITNHRALIGVVIPVAAAWVEHLIDYNWAQVRQSIAEGEQAIAAGAPMATPDDLAGEADAPQGPALPLLAAVAGQTVSPSARSAEALDRLRAALTVPDSGRGRPADAAEPAVRTVRIGDLSARVIEQAGDAGQTLAITHDRELIGIVIPVTQSLVQFLIEQNVSRVLYNIGLGEKQLGTSDALTTLDQLEGQEAPGKSQDPRVNGQSAGRMSST